MGRCVVVLVEVFYVEVVMLVVCCLGMIILWLLKVVVEWMMVLRLWGLVMLLSVMISVGCLVFVVVFIRLFGWVYLYGGICSVRFWWIVLLVSWLSLLCGVLSIGIFCFFVVLSVLCIWLLMLIWLVMYMVVMGIFVCRVLIMLL